MITRYHDEHRRVQRGLYRLGVTYREDAEPYVWIGCCAMSPKDARELVRKTQEGDWTEPWVARINVYDEDLPARYAMVLDDSSFNYCLDERDVEMMRTGEMMCLFYPCCADEALTETVEALAEFLTQEGLI